LCQSTSDALVLRSALRQSSQSPSCRSVESITASQWALLPLRLLATAQTRRHFVELSAASSINVVSSRVDHAVYSPDTAFLPSPSNLVSCITNTDANKTAAIVETDTLSSYICAKRYIEQLAADLMSTDKLETCNTPRLSAFETNSNRHPGNLHHLQDLPNTDEYKETDTEQEEKEQGRYRKATEQARRQMTSFRSTLAPKIENKKNYIDVNYSDQPHLRLSRYDVDSSVIQKDEAKGEKRDDDRLPVDTVARRNKNGDGVISGEALPVLAAKDKRRAGGEPCWQPTEDHELNIDQQSRLSPGEWWYQHFTA